MATPDRLRIPLDQYHFQNVGRLPDGTQFMAFVTGVFPSAQKYYMGKDWRRKKRWLAVIHRFDPDGRHLGTDARLAG